MFLTRPRFGLAPAAIMIFAAGIGVGSLLGPAWSGRPLTASAAASPAAPAPAHGTTRYPVEVTRVIDGDTFEGRVRAWPGIEIATKVRLRNIDAPEMRGRCPDEYAVAQAARDALVTMLGEGGVTISQVSLDKYGGRVLAAASTRRVDDISMALLETGLVRRYSGGRRESWC